jgi:hypothetical protein
MSGLRREEVVIANFARTFCEESPRSSCTTIPPDVERARPKPNIAAGGGGPTDTVDAFVEERVLPEFRDIVAMVRALMRECAPQATERISYGLPMWIGNSALAWISPSKRDITVGFTYGREFEDPYGLLRGAGKHARHVKIRKLEDANQEALRSYIRQALERDSR